MRRASLVKVGATVNFARLPGVLFVLGICAFAALMFVLSWGQRR